MSNVVTEARLTKQQCESIVTWLNEHLLCLEETDGDVELTEYIYPGLIAGLKRIRAALKEKP